jgi:hypothetical protein
MPLNIVRIPKAPSLEELHARWVRFAIGGTLKYGNKTMTNDQKTKKASQELSRYKRVLMRQKEYAWGPKYQPATRAVRGEAPRISVASTMPCQLLQRKVHALSNPEKFCFALALYHPNLWEFHEQHVLYPGAKQHPMAAHRRFSGQAWPSTSGTFRIAKHLGLEKYHPMVWEPKNQSNPHHATLDTLLDGEDQGRHLPTPYQGDALLFMRDERGEYLVSWDVKAKTGDHAQPGGEMIEQMKDGALAKALARDAIYVEYMRELQIPIVRISLDDIPASIRARLHFLCLAHTQPIDLPDTMVADLIGAFQLGITKEQIPLAIINRHVKTDAQFIAAKNLLQIAIWERKIRVDLRHPVLVDSPLVPEAIDLLVEFGHLFAH